MLLLPVSHGIHTPAGGATSLSFVASATAATATITPPGGSAAGDWAILLEGGTANPTMTTPTGWGGPLLQRTANNYDIVCHYKTLTSGDLSTGVGAYASASSPNELNKIMAVFRPSGGSISGVAVQDLTEETAGDPAVQTINADLGSAPLISFVFAGWTGASAPTITLSTNEESLSTITINTGTSKLLLGYKIYSSAGVEGDVDITGDGTTFNEYLASCYVEFTIS